MTNISFVFLIYFYIIKQNTQRYGNVFPRDWCILHRMALDFAKRTKTMITNILLKIDPPESADVELLLKGLTKTLAFEREAAATFEVNAARQAVLSEGQLNENSADSMLMDDDGNVVDPNSSAGIQLKYKRLGERNARKEKVEQMEQEQKEMEQKGLKTIDVKFRGYISRSFDAYMIAYVKKERQNMENMLDEVMAEDGSTDDQSGLPVLSSSVNLFGYIKQSVKRCTGYSTGQTFYNLQKEYQDVLTRYSNLLINKLPKPLNDSSSNNNNGDDKNVAAHANYKLDDGEDVLRMACLIVNTSEYCAETSPQLADMVREKIDEAFKDHINMDAIEDSFYDVINISIRVLASGLEQRLLKHLDIMTKMPWDTWADVGDQSQYIGLIHQTCLDVVPLLKKLLSETYFRSFCDSFISSFLPQ